MSIKILISAGEPSGEMHAARLAEALRARTGASFFGLGGTKMRDADVELLADCSQVSVVGISEVIRRLPQVWSVYRRLADEAARRKPALAILVDFPDFNLRLARRLHAQGTRIVYFISPQVWAWRPGRVHLIKRLVERVICIFPFEEKFYRDAGVAADFVGHPLVDSVHATRTRAEFCAAHGFDPAKRIVALLPGSRSSEAQHNLPAMLGASVLLGRKQSSSLVLPVAPGLAIESIETLLHSMSGMVVREGDPAGDVTSSAPYDCKVRCVQGETYDALAAADCAIVASGTATVEAALLGTPMVVVYRVSGTTAFIARRLVRTPFFSMVNLIAGRRVVTELIQEDFTPQAVADETRRLLDSAEAREQMKRDLAEVRAKLGPPGAIARAADVIAREL